MTRGRSTLFLFLALAALVAYIALVEHRRDPTPEAEKKEKVFAVEAGAVEALQVTSSTGETTVLEKVNGTWRIVAPVEAEADEGEVSSLVSGLASLELQRVVEEDAADLGAFGLDRPTADVAFRTAGETEFRHLLLGSKTPTGGDLYATLASSRRVFLIAGWLDATFDRKPFDLRNKAVLRVERDKVDSLEVVSASQRLRFEKREDAWRMTSPLSAKADYGSVEGLLSRIVTGQMRSIAAADADANELKAFGLDRPRHTVTLGAGSAVSSFLVSAKTSPEGQPYARDASRPIVFTVDAFIVEDLKKTAADFRPKELFEFRTFNGTRFELTRDDKTVVFEKRTGKEEGAPERWMQVEPAEDVEETKIIDGLSKVSNLRADSFVDVMPPGAGQTVRVRALSTGGKKEDLVTFFEVGDDVYATRAADPGAARVKGTDFRAALAAFDAAR
jgi:hypothetical protein